MKIKLILNIIKGFICNNEGGGAPVLENFVIKFLNPLTTKNLNMKKLTNYLH